VVGRHASRDEALSFVLDDDAIAEALTSLLAPAIAAPDRTAAAAGS
jgi:hypothetical protein